MTTSTVFPASSALCVRKRSINKSKFHGWGLFRHYIALLVVFVVLVSPVFLPLLGAFKSSGDPIYGLVAKDRYAERNDVETFDSLGATRVESTAPITKEVHLA